MSWWDIIPLKSQSRSGHILRPQLAPAPGVAAAGLPRCFPYESHVFPDGRVGKVSNVGHG